MEKKTFEAVLEVKADEADGRTIIGYASTFGNLDNTGDIVIKGAFGTINTKTPKMLYNHDRNIVIGKWDSIVEDETGLLVSGKLANTPKGNELAELIRMGAVNSLSIGYKTNDYEITTDGTRLLKDVDLWEISVVTFPANEAAEISSIKAAARAEATELLTLLRKRVNILS